MNENAALKKNWTIKKTNILIPYTLCFFALVKLPLVISEKLRDNPDDTDTSPVIS